MNVVKKMSVALSLAIAATVSVQASQPSYNLNSTMPFTSIVRVYNQTSNYYTVNSVYMNQNNNGDRYSTTLYPSPQYGSSLQFTLSQPNYAVYLQIVREYDHAIVYGGYSSSDDIYLKPYESNGETVTVSHR